MLSDENIREYNSTRDINAREVLCYIPFSHLFFSFNGIVQNCCFSGKQSYLGKWPEKSISQIWFGDSFTKFRTAIKQNNLSFGCKECEHRIAEGNFENVPAKTYDYYAPAANLTNPGYPQVMEFELDNTCNLECVMCDGRFSSSIRRNREKLQPVVSPYNHDFISQLEEFIPHLKRALFYGGEPFMTNIYLAIWEKMVGLNPQIEIRVQTNGTFLNQRIKDIFEAGRFHICVSIDALDKSLFETVRANSNFERIMQNLEYFTAYSKSKNTELTITPSPIIDTWREIPKLLRFANSKKVNVVYNIVAHPKNLAIRNLPSAELKNILDLLAAENVPQTNAIEKANAVQYTNYITHIKHLYLQAQQREQTMPEDTHRQEANLFFECMNNYLHQQFEPGEWVSGNELIENKAKQFLQRAKAKGSYSLAVKILNEAAPETILSKYPHAVNFDALYQLLSAD